MRQKQIQIISIVIGAILMGLSVILLSTLFLDTIQNKSFEKETLSNFIFNLIPLIFGYILLIFGKYYENFPKYLSKVAISFSVIFFTIGTILFSFNSHSNEFVDSFQDTLDTLLISVIENQNSNESKELLKLLEESQKFETFTATKLTQNQINELSEILNLETFENKKEILDSIISIMDSSLKEQNLSKEPIPIELISAQLNQFEIDYSLIPDFIESNQNNQITLILKDKNKNNLSKKENLKNLRENCKQYNKSQTCQAILITNFDNLIKELQNENSTAFPIEIPNNIISQINSSETIKETINSKTTNYSNFFLISIFLILISIILLNLNEKTSNIKETYFEKIYLVIKLVTRTIIPQVLILSIFYYLFVEGDIFEIISQIIQDSIGLGINLNLNSMETFKIVSTILYEILIIHIITLLMFLILIVSFYFFKKQKINSTN